MRPLFIVSSRSHAPNLHDILTAWYTMCCLHRAQHAVRGLLADSHAADLTLLAVQAEAPAQRPPARPVPQLGDKFHCGACSMGPIVWTLLTHRTACAVHVRMSPCCLRGCNMLVCAGLAPKGTGFAPAFGVCGDGGGGLPALVHSCELSGLSGRHVSSLGCRSVRSTSMPIRALVGVPSHALMPRTRHCQGSPGGRAVGSGMP